jgi:hypothetical protein
VYIGSAGDQHIWESAGAGVEVGQGGLLRKQAMVFAVPLGQEDGGKKLTRPCSRSPQIIMISMVVAVRALHDNGGWDYR